MKRRYGCLALAALLFMGSAVTARADEYKGREGWEASFTGDAIESNFTSQSFADEAASLLPGDSIEIQVAVKNESGQGTDWYMSNDTVKSLEDSSQARGGAYAYELTYEGAEGAKTLFSSRSIGTQDGLQEATDTLNDFFYLDHLSGGAQGTVTLKVALDGETQGNSYQNTLARLQLNFAVEKEASGGGSRRGGSGGGNGGGSVSPGPGSVVYSPGAVQTGDQSSLVFWSAAALICGLLLLILSVISLKKMRGGYEHE